jgi:hypothetical protein
LRPGGSGGREKLHKDVKALGLQDSFFLKRSRLQSYLLLFVVVVNVTRDLVTSLNLRSVEGSPQVR